MTDRRRRDRREDRQIQIYSLEAEQSLIGALLIDNSKLSEVLTICDESHIFRDDHRRILRHIREVIESGETADIVTVFASIERSNEVDQTGGMEYLGDIANNTPSAAAILSYARCVRERALMRALAECGQRFLELSGSPGGIRLPDMMQAAQERWNEVKGDYKGYTGTR